MIHAIRFGIAVLWYTVRSGSRAIVAAYRGMPDQPGGVYDRETHRWARSLLQASRVTVHVVGAERLRPRPCVYVANHASIIDIWALVVALPGPPKFVFKKELMRVPVFGKAAKAAGHICIDRHHRSAAFAAYDAAAMTIRNGVSAVVFAEGTRSRDGRLLQFKKGPFVLAIAAQVPVVPVVIEGSYELMPRLSYYPRSGEVTLRIGEEIPTAGMHYDERDGLSTMTRGALVSLGARE